MIKERETFQVERGAWTLVRRSNFACGVWEDYCEDDQSEDHKESALRDVDESQDEAGAF